MSKEPERHEYLTNEPVVVITEDFKRKMFMEASLHPNLETAGMFFGLDIEDNDERYIIPIVSFTPNDEDEIKREKQSVVIGGPGCIRYGNWAWVYWDYAIDNGLADGWEETELLPLGIWHLHPRGSAEYSKQDYQDSTDFFEDEPDKNNVMLIILSEFHPTKTKKSAALYPYEGHMYEINIYFRQRGQKDVRSLRPVFEDLSFPDFPDAPWFAREPKVYKAEIRKLQDTGFTVKSQIRIVGENSEPELCLSCTDNSNQKIVHIRLPNNYDQSRIAYLSNDDFDQENRSEMKYDLWEMKKVVLSEILPSYLLFQPKE